MKKLSLLILLASLGWLPWSVVAGHVPFPFPSRLDLPDTTVDDDGEPYELHATNGGEVTPE